MKYIGTEATITLIGELDIAVVDDVRQFVKMVVDRDGLSSVHMDLRRVTFIDSSGLMILIRARQVAHDHLLTFSLGTVPSGPVARILTICGLADMFAEQHPGAAA